MATQEQEKSSNQSRSAAAQAASAPGNEGKSEKANGGMQDKTAARADDSAIELLKADHRKVEQLFSSYETAKRRQEKAKIAQDICRELIIHAEIEEEIFYPACREHVEDSMLDEAQVEHDGAKILIAEIAAGSPSDEFFDAKVKVLSEYIRHHVQEEEKRADSIFAQAKSGGLAMAEVGQKMQARKDELKKEMEKELILPQPVTLDVSIGEEEGMEEKMASRDYGRGRYDEDEDRRGRRMPERDEFGRFMSEDESEGRGGRSGGGSRGYASRGRDEDDYRSSGRSGGGAANDQGHGGWFGDPEGHSEASRRGWEHRDQGGRMNSGRGGESDERRSSSRAGDYDERRSSSRGRDDDDRRYSSQGGEYRSSSNRGDYSDDRGQGGWFGDREGYAEAARRGWEEREREGRSSRSSGGGRDYDERRHTSRGRDDDDRRSSRSGGDYGRSSRGGDDSDDRGQGGWFGDPEGHSEAARRGWEHRR